MAFRIGDMAVYAAHGIGEVTGIECREISGREQTFYILRLRDSATTVMVPTDEACAKRLRAVIPKSDVKKIFAALKQKSTTPLRQTWNRRHRDYVDRLSKGSLFDVADVLRELTQIRSRKELSFSERRVFETARSMLVQELALAGQTARASIEQELDAILR